MFRRGVGIEDAVAAWVLSSASGETPPLPPETVLDENLGVALNLSTTSQPQDLRYALRFAAGFGSQVALALYGRDR